MKDAFLQSIRDEYPNEEVTRLVFADWCLENESNLENKLRTNLPPIDNLHINPSYGYQYGPGYGNGYGSGFGLGYGSGSGYGNGCNGSGDGSVYGLGYGNGLGSGTGYNCQNPKLNMPKLHTNQLIFLSHNFIFCGFIQEHIQTYQFKITNASLILSHESSWHEVTNNTNRNIQIRKFGTITIGPQFFHSIDWIGDLP